MRQIGFMEATCVRWCGNKAQCGKEDPQPSGRLLAACGHAGNIKRALNPLIQEMISRASAGLSNRAYEEAAPAAPFGHEQVVNEFTVAGRCAHHRLSWDSAAQSVMARLDGINAWVVWMRCRLTITARGMNVILIVPAHTGCFRFIYICQGFSLQNESSPRSVSARPVLPEAAPFTPHRDHTCCRALLCFCSARTLPCAHRYGL